MSGFIDEEAGVGTLNDLPGLTQGWGGSCGLQTQECPALGWCSSSAGLSVSQGVSLLEPHRNRQDLPGHVHPQIVRHAAVFLPPAHLSHFHSEEGGCNLAGQPSNHSGLCGMTTSLLPAENVFIFKC